MKKIVLDISVRQAIKTAGYITTFVLCAALNLALLWVLVVFGLGLRKALHFAIRADRQERRTARTTRDLEEWNADMAELEIFYDGKE